MIRRSGAAVGRVLAGAVFTVLGVILVVIPWAFQRVLRHDPLGDSPGWVRRVRRHGQAARSWAPDPSRSRRGRRSAIDAVVVVLALVLVAGATPPGRAALSGWWRTDHQTRTPFTLAPVPAKGGPTEPLHDPVDPNQKANRHDPAHPAALRGQAWASDPAYTAAINWATSPSGAWQPENPYRMRDFRSRYVNVVDGRRRSYVPPPCGCRPVTVWVYGGSTTWGIDQRDDHTIPAELGRVAHEHGITADVQNRGQLGDNRWMEGERFAWDLTREPAPDIVVFYDGVNDAWTTNVLDATGSVAADQIIDPTLTGIWASTGRSKGPVPAGPPGSRLIGRPGGPAPRGHVAYLQLLVDRYDRARGVAEASAKVHGIVSFSFWQPNRFTRPVQPDEPQEDAAVEDASRLDQQLIRERLPRGVIDLGDVLDQVPGPLYTDDVHHDERGARVIAEAIYAHIEEQMSAAQQRHAAAN